MLSPQFLYILRHKDMAVIATDIVDLMVQEMPSFLLQPDIQWGQPSAFWAPQDALWKSSFHCLLEGPLSDSVEAITADFGPSREGSAVSVELSVQHGQAHTNIVVL